MFFFKSNIPSVSVEKAFEELSPHSNIVLLDVREPFEYQEGHISNSIILPLSEIKQKVVALVPRKDTPIFVYCRSGNRSTKAAHQLIHLGYTNVFNITGGILEWSQKNFPIEK